MPNFDLLEEVLAVVQELVLARQEQERLLVVSAELRVLLA